MRTLNFLSVVVPCYNEEEIILDSHLRLTRLLTTLLEKSKCTNYELIYIDDGSNDKTPLVLKSIFEKDKHVRIVTLRRNFGLQAAITAGLSSASGDAVVTIDADLQDPPEKIEEMIAHYEEGYDLVLGVRQDRSNDSFSKKFFAENYYRLMKLMGVKTIHNHGDFRLMSRSLVDDFNHLPERSRIIRLMILRLESRFATVSYSRDARKAGRTKFTPHVMLSFSLEGLISFSMIPLRLSFFLGAIMFLIAIAGTFWAVYIRMTQNLFPEWTLTLLPVLGIGGLQLLILGIMGEYIGKLLLEVKQRPIYLVREELRHD